MYFLEHVEVVVRGAAVGADADFEAELEHLGDGSNTGAEFQVAGGVVRDAGAGVFLGAHFALVDVDAVGGQHAGVETGAVS